MRTLLLAGAWLLAATAGAQELKNLDVTFAYDIKGKPAVLQNLAVRPNVTQPVYFYLTNPNPAMVKDVTFRLVQVYPGGRIVDVVRGGVKQIAANQTEPVVFDKLKAPPKDEASWPRLDGPPFRFSLILDFQGLPKPERSDPFPFDIDSPTDYVTVEKANYDTEKRRLSFRVKTAKELNPPCPVELVLDPFLVPGLIPSKAGAFLQELDRENKEVELAAENITFEKGPPESARVTINVDGYERAFLFKCTFADGTVKRLADKNRARMLAPRYSAGQEFMQVPLQIDVPAQTKASVELGFDKAGIGEFVVTPFPSPREQIVQYNVTEDGTLLFRTQVRDWVAKTKTKGVFGGRDLRLQLKGENGMYLTLADEQGTPGETLPYFEKGIENPYGPLSFEASSNSVFAHIIIDPTPPQLLRFESIPEKVVAGIKFRPSLTIKPRTSEQAPILKGNVVFFLGQPDKDEKIPPMTPLVDGIWSEDDGAWVALQDLLIPAEQKDKIVLSARATTAAGVSAFKSQIFYLVSATEEKKKKIEFVKITGLVMHGDLAQQKTKIGLYNVKDPKAEAKFTQSDTAGKYEFTKVPPGNYVILAEKTPYALVARVPVDVPDDKEALDVPLKLRAK